MLEALKKAFGNEPKKEILEQAAPIIEEGLIDLTQLDINEQLNVALNEIIAKDITLAELGTQLSGMAKEIEDYKEKLAALQDFAAEAEARAMAAAEEMKAKEVADKKQQLADVIGADNAGFDTTWQAVAGLEGEAFNVVLNGFKASFAKEAESVYFTEVGVSGEAEPVAETGLKLNKHLPKKTK